MNRIAPCRAALPLLLVVALGACALHGTTPREAANRAALAEARPVGAPVDCVQTRSISHTRVRSDQVIDFYFHGGQVLRNRLPQACPGLGFDESFTHRTATGQLCSVDTIRVNHPQGMGATCGLGPFQPIETRHR
jgi:hypothetical protein